MPATFDEYALAWQPLHALALLACVFGLLQSAVASIVVVIARQMRHRPRAGSSPTPLPDERRTVAGFQCFPRGWY